MRFRRALALGAIIAALTPVPARAATVGVKTQGLNFVPAIANARIGDTVLWSNTATDRHSTTSAGPTPWDSGNMTQWGGQYSRAFPFAGSFPYYCTLHRSTGMTGAVRVALKVAPTSGTTATDFVITLAKAGTAVPPGHRFVVQKALGAGAYSTAVVTTSATAHFRATTRGTYKLRAGLQKTSGAVNVAWFSEPLTLTVS